MKNGVIYRALFCCIKKMLYICSVLDSTNMKKYIRTLTISFETEILFREIPLFRGAVIKCLGDRANVLYHNHTSEDTFRYAYPLVQYKRINGKAAIVCVERAVDLIGQLLTEIEEVVMIGNGETVLKVAHLQPARILIQMWKSPFTYHISRWLPLNSENYQLYKNTEGVVERVSLLENILKGNLLSMLKGLDIHVEDEIMVKITDISNPFLLYNKGIGLMAFNADFICNMTIPNNVGIGKNASIGFGVVHQVNK